MYMNILRELNVVETEKEEVRVGGETHDDKKEEEGRKEEEEEEQEEKEETAPLSEEKEDGREENTKQDPTKLLNDGRTELNEKGKEATRRIKESARKRREKIEKTCREEHRRREKEKRRKEQVRTDDRNAIISKEQQVPRIQNQAFVIKTDKVEIHGKALQNAIDQANKHERYIRHESAKSKSHREAERHPRRRLLHSVGKYFGRDIHTVCGGYVRQP